MNSGSGGAGMFALGILGCFYTTAEFFEAIKRMDEVKTFIGWDFLLVVGWYGLVSFSALVCPEGGKTQRYCTWLVLTAVLIRVISVLIKQLNGQFDTLYSDALYQLFFCLMAAMMCFISLIECAPSSESDHK